MTRTTKKGRSSALLRRLTRTEGGERTLSFLAGNGDKLLAALAVIIAFSLVIRVLSVWTVPEWYTQERNSPMIVYGDFYSLDKESADVLLLGGSRAEAAFVPQVLYDRYGITSCGLCAGDQGLRENYYWLEEALRFQSPKAVVLDISVLAGAPVEADAARKALTYMKWSGVKWEAVRTMCGDPAEGDLASWVFPGLWFHGRWKSLSEEDFRSGELKSRRGLMGWSPRYTDRCGEAYTPVTVTAADSMTEESGQEVWLDEIIRLCGEKGIHLLFTVTPASDLTQEQHARMQALADDRKVRLFDFGTQALYARIGYDFGADQHDSTHANADGARKISEYLGTVLSEDYGIAQRQSIRWRDTRSAYESSVREAQLQHAETLSEYIPLLAEERYDLFVTTNGDAGIRLSEEDRRLLLNLGIKVDLDALDGRAYYAVPGSQEGRFEEKAAAETGTVLRKEGLFRGGRSRYTLVSVGGGAGDVSWELVIGGMRFEPAGRGLSVVVYDAERMTIADTAVFAPGTGERVR